MLNDGVVPLISPGHWNQQTRRLIAERQHEIEAKSTVVGQRFRQSLSRAKWRDMLRRSRRPLSDTPLSLKQTSLRAFMMDNPEFMEENEQEIRAYFRDPSQENVQRLMRKIKQRIISS